MAGAGTPEGKEPTWHESLLGYCDNWYLKRAAAELMMWLLARRSGIWLDYHVQTNWQPVDSQRLMMWAGRFGKQELYMSALARRHFEQRKSASHRSTLLEAAEEAGLDVKAAAAFLETDELRADVWRSYGDMIRGKGIHAIPFFVFNSPLTDGGPFGSGKGKPVIVNGSADQRYFLEIFEGILKDVEGTENVAARVTC
eukprot:gnl/TRDRNA2_/TRDRNA2_149376_c0_seq1.p1 gnl/TRDRNA2_/TRDRNA2_149376_c0~~gnl/TRDRNA2_/TRDRNA2_149376_c0_seq1.p1  ORF type:complete len:198 (+),score=33.62 gnl/TRDRNA2_/TRDRNA2_149376_c0_seq1:312-905(+)